jgi:hypothetical protein
MAETKEKNEEIADKLNELKSILQHSLGVDHFFPFNSLKIDTRGRHAK